MRRTDSLLAKELGVKEVIMSKFAKDTRATVIPCLRYRNAPAAIEWLCKTFGFEKQLVVPNEDGTIVHAQLTFGNGMIMLGSVLKVETEFGRLMKQPDEIGGAETQSAYVVVSDADVAYQRAKAAGAEIVIEIKDEDYGGRVFSCRDLEGRLWNFGTYDPW
ncbi:MAG TPA: VOC family protein [Isosphaeraceae bacterium]|nr:VOC family protein [Isosphaeraceae bacterium]